MTAEMAIDPVIRRLLAAPYGHQLRWLDSGLHSTVLTLTGGEEVMIVAPTFNESVTRALDIADDMALPNTALTTALSSSGGQLG